MLPLILINVFIIVAGGFLTPLWGDFMYRIGGDVVTAGKAIAIFSIVIGLFTFLAGRIESALEADEYFLMFSQLGFVFGYMAYFAVHHPWQLYCVEAWLGFCGAFQAPAIYTLYQRYMPDEKRNTAWGFWIGAYNVSIGTGAFMSAYIAEQLGFAGVFSGMFLISVLGLVLSLFVGLSMRRLRLQAFHE